MPLSTAAEGDERRVTALVVTFGSRCHPGADRPSAAFQNTVLQVQRESSIPFDVKYLLAWRNDWYMSGIRDLAESFDDAVVKLHELVAGRPSVFVGNSMGGYAALAFGVLVPATRVLAFSPQTRFDTGETRWPDLPTNHWSIRNLMNHERATTHATVIIGSSEERDLAYAADIADLPGVRIVDHPKGGHDVVHFLRNKGELHRMLREEIAEASMRQRK